jgi:hypothetical protein
MQALPCCGSVLGPFWSFSGCSFQGRDGADLLSGQVREMHIDCCYVLAKAYPGEILTIARCLMEIDRIIQAWTQLGGDVKLHEIELLD